MNDESIMQDVLLMIEKLKENKKYGPYEIWISKKMKRWLHNPSLKVYAERIANWKKRNERRTARGSGGKH